MFAEMFLFPFRDILVAFVNFEKTFWIVRIDKNNEQMGFLREYNKGSNNIRPG